MFSNMVYEICLKYSQQKNCFNKQRKTKSTLFPKSQWRALLCAVSTEKANYARDNSLSLVNAKENPTTEEQETLAAVCVWENNV